MIEFKRWRKTEWQIKKKYLVEIRVKDWMPDLPKDKDFQSNRILAFEEVEDAYSDWAAMSIAFDRYVERVKHTPTLKKKLAGLGIFELTGSYICAPDAVEI